MSLRTAGRLAARCSRLHGCGPAQLAALLDAPTSHSKSPLQPLWAALPRRFNDYDAAQAQAWGSRGLHVSSPACAVEEVLVPSMGDSISEGQRHILDAAVAVAVPCMSITCTHSPEQPASHHDVPRMRNPIAQPHGMHR